MANVSSQFMDDLGPLAALWAGRDQGLQENSTLVNQQIGLENIANSQQTRDIQKQKLPFELGQLEHQKQMNPLLIGQQETKNKADKVKLDKDQFDKFFEEFKVQVPNLTGTPADASILGEIAKKNGMDPNDPRISRMIQTGASGNQKAISDMITKIAQMSEKHIQDMTKERFTQDQQTGRTRLEQEGANQRNAATNAAGLQRAKISAAAKAGALKDKSDIYALTRGDPVKMHAMLVMKAKEAQQAGDVDKATALYEMANDPTLLASVQNQQAQRPQVTVTPEGGIGQSGGVQPIPPAGPQGAAPPKAGTPQRAVGTKAKTKDGRDVTWDGKGWVLD